MKPKIKTILLAASLGDETRYLFAYALSLAENYAARIHVVHGHEVPDITAQYMAEIYMFQEALEANYEKSLEETESRLHDRLETLCLEELSKQDADRKLLAGVKIIRRPAKLAILDTAIELGADLIVMGAHRHSVLTDALLGSTTMKVLHSTPIPVFVVRIPS